MYKSPLLGFRSQRRDMLDALAMRLNHTKQNIMMLPIWPLPEPAVEAGRLLQAPTQAVPDLVHVMTSLDAHKSFGTSSIC